MKQLIIKRLNLLICCLCVVVAYGYYAINDYMHYKDYDVTVVNTLTGTQGKGSSLSFIAVYELNDGYRFSEYISPEMYSSIEKGDNITVSLRPFDVKQTLFDNIVWFFGMVLVQSVCCAYIVFSIIFCVFSKIEN
ncbi:hypothetical protein A9J68_09595 [Salmonella enterica subsp. enterica serovar Braenderup]|uniref:Mur ligase domain-containing protein n=2 Tax=Tequatrovirus TaxID=10663 RepID=A0A5B9MTF6_9CAUD|nr:Mur ligase domain-containing protein [Shigella phage CM8]EDB5153638.1 hypothetical protein [Salmonella enterica subsp. enterica serovar Braenderup]EDU9380919.1 hypothetical protein [Salmonella enterica subsp. enterica serovar Mikawasima]EFD8442347.1 hypothetical protein [Escherichia coli]QEG05130.1 Mur ligase domain-containing protein [Shigella phage JK23]QEG04771.1 Mur ligase domain-containing protein [Shigella phage CM8]